jgi:DNA primase
MQQSTHSPQRTFQNYAERKIENGWTGSVNKTKKVTVMYDKIVESCRFLLNNFPAAREAKAYLDSRLTPESQEMFQFGYFPDIYNISALTDLVDEQALRDAKLLFTRNIEDSLYPRTINSVHFEDFPLIMPFRDAHGHVMSLVGRTLISEEERATRKMSKYRNTIGFKKGQCLFGLYENKQSILEQDLVHIVEGQFDLIKAREKGIKNIIALGTSHMTNYQFSVISRYTNNIILLLDNDEAGHKGREQTVKKFGNLANIQNWYIPEVYKDIDEYLTKENISEYADMSFVVKG